MPQPEDYLSGITPKIDTKGNAGNAIFRTRNWHFLGQDPTFNSSESFDASKQIFSDFKNGRLSPESRYNTIPGSVNTKGYYKNDQGDVHAVIRDVYDPSLREKRVVKVGPDGLNLKGQEYVSQFFYDNRGNQFMNDQNTIAFPRPIIDYARFAKGKEEGRMDYEKALYARQLMNGLRATLKKHGVDDKYLKKRGLPNGLDSFSGDVFDNLRLSGDGNVLAALAEFTGVPLMTLQAPRGDDVNQDPNRVHTKNYNVYFDDYDNLSNFMKENYGDAAYSDGYTETPVNLFANGGRLTTRKDDNIFSPAHIFADGGEMGNSSPAPNYRIEDDRVVFSGPVRYSDYYDIMNARKEAQDQEEKQKRDWLIEYRKEKTIDQKKTIEQLALDTIRGKYGNGKERKIALGDNYSAVQKRIDEILRDRQNKNRDLDENPRSVIRADGEEKRHIGETDKYDIYL